mmetsp:Transcript_1503/g.5538  ORF Transcript_1503/g.5538 Transcript_1503/m.5538 type:complete len:235 (+) Transcript_1503:3-707(+)
MMRSSRARVVVSAAGGGGMLERIQRALKPAQKPAKKPRFQRAVGCALGLSEPPPGLELCTVAGGCFWGLQLAFERLDGVVSTKAGYTGGDLETPPTYELVLTGETGHAEAVQIVFDPAQVSYAELLDVFFAQIDPTTRNRQGKDVGTQYRSAIFCRTAAQRELAEVRIAAENETLLATSISAVRLGRKVVTTVESAGPFWEAEKMHQLYLAKGGRFGRAQSAAKGCTDPIRCYG